MEVRTEEKLESTAYCNLLEGIKEKGLDPFLRLAKDIKTISEKEVLIWQTVYAKQNDLDMLKQRHRDTMDYFREKIGEMTCYRFTNPLILNTLTNLSQNISLLDLYLKNARKLEEIKISLLNLEPHFLEYNKEHACGIYRNKQGKIIRIKKWYTDGKIKTTGEEIIVDPESNCSEIRFTLDQKKKPSFLLVTDNGEEYQQKRQIYMEDFGFDGAKLPTEEELRKYEIPNELIRKRKF